ncbi:SLC13 family permease [Acidobacteria bacterium AH-259-L09]|nr:SLC13 family permease [Acidobacteria bacterium AH-259-L09]
MTIEMFLLSVIVLGAVVLFAVDVFPVDKVSVLILSVLVAVRLISPEQAIAGFGNPATVTVACMLALSYGIQSTGGLNYVANKIVDLAGESEHKILVSIIIAVGILSAFINNTAAVALFLPLTIAVAREQRLDVSKLLMPMSFAAIFAGTCTLIGTSTNLLVYSLALEHLDWKIGMFEFAHAGLIFFAVGTVYLLFIGHRLVPSRRTGDSLTEEYRLRHFVTELILQDNSPLIGKSIVETKFREKYDLEVIEILRGTTRLLPTSVEARLEGRDILLVQGDPHTLMKIQDTEGFILKALTVEDQDLEDENIVLVEAFISPTSHLVESTLKEVNFRRTFNANALAIRSHGRTIREKIGKISLEYGDSLLILTNREQLEVLRQSPDFLVLEEVRVSFLRKDKVYYAVGAFLGVVVLAALDIVSIVEAAVIGTGFMILTGCLRLRDLYSHLSWQTIVMLACLIPLGTAMENTGLAKLIAGELVEQLDRWGPIAVLSGIYLFTSLLTSAMSNNATAVLMVPIALSTAYQLQVDPKPFVMAVMFAASASFMTPVGYQTNLFIFGPGGYKFADFLKVGGPLNLLFWILASIFIPLFWPL